MIPNDKNDDDNDEYDDDDDGDNNEDENDICWFRYGDGVDDCVEVSSYYSDFGVVVDGDGRDGDDYSCRLGALAYHHTRRLGVSQSSSASWTATKNTLYHFNTQTNG